MGWAAEYIKKLQAGEEVKFRPQGKSMEGRIYSGDTVIVGPIKPDTELKVDDIVLCTVGRYDYLHLIKAVGKGGYTIGNNKGRINGTIPREKVWGKLVRIEP